MARVANISVAISTMDRPDALGRCLDALLAGDVLPAEAVIVDQSLSDQSRQVVEERRSGAVPIIYVRQEPRGLAASQNAAVEHANYPIVAVIDDDCVAERGWIAAIERAFASGGLDVVTGRVLPLPPEGERIYPVSSRTNTVRTDFKGKSSPWLVGSGNNFAVKRELYLGIGGCDERLGPGSPGKGGVDMDLFYRLLRAGARICYEPESLVHHERQDKAGRISRRPMYGHGMGACCTLWLRQGDLYALRILGSWLLMRTKLMASALLHQRWMSAHEEMLMLAGTARGLVFGLLVSDRARNYAGSLS